MFKKNYYCLIAGLPDLFFNENKLSENSVAFCNSIKNDISKADFEQVQLLLLPTDNKNLLQLLFSQKPDFSALGNFSKKFLEEQILQPKQIPAYMGEFLKWIKTEEHKEINLQVENHLQKLFYRYIFSITNNFLKNWFVFDLHIKNIMTAFNCNRFQYEMQDQLIDLEENANVCSLLLKGKYKPEYFEDDLPLASEIFKVAESDQILIEKEKTIDRIKWEYLDEMTFFHFFSIEKILSFVLKLQITERWIKLDKETGQALLNQLINDLKTSYKFPAEFSTVN